MLSNKHNLALPLAMFLAYDDYDLQVKQENQLSVTDLLKPTRQLILRNRVAQSESPEIMDVTSRTAVLLGELFIMPLKTFCLTQLNEKKH